MVKEHSIQKLVIFERKVLREMSGPTKESNFVWRIETYVELDELIQRKNNIVIFNSSQRLNGCQKK
jgi:spore germination protein GerM